MNTVYIFGDSFADSSSSKYAWPNRLKENYTVKNYALGGTGPDWSLKNFLKIVDEVHPENSYCIFCISDIARISLKFMEPKTAHLVRFYFGNKTIRHPNLKTHESKLEKYEAYNSFLYKLNKNYLSYSTFYATEFLKIILFIKFYSDSFKKTLIFPCFDELSTQQLIRLNTNKNFYVHNKPLNEYSEESLNPYHNPYGDTRINHMIESQHTEFYNIIINLLKSN
jgi:hypothetical protein